jgi:acyl-CoA synthetase (NDP forming)
VALKVMSPNILRKSEARVVALNLQDREELRNAYGRTLEKARVANPRARIRGVLVQEMIRGGTEWRMEFRRDSRFGPLVETGISGVYTEILPDGVIRVAPFDEKEALCMIRESRGYPLLLEGWRRDPLDMVAFASALSAFSRLAFCEREVARLDVNPLFVNKKGVLVVDAFIEKKGRKK